MSLTLQKARDRKVVRAFTAKLADIPNGVTVSSAELVAGGILAEGTAIAPDNNNLYHVVKCAQVAETATSSAKVYNVYKGHHFKVGDVVFAVANGAGYAISKIEAHSSNPALDVITLSTSLGVEVAQGAVLSQATTAGGSGATPKYNAVALVGESYRVDD